MKDLLLPSPIPAAVPNYLFNKSDFGKNRKLLLFTV
jgi:hypothetical protein